MTKWKYVVLGFILAVIIKTFFARYEIVGLLIVGFLVGYLAHEGTIGGLWNAALAGTFGTIVSAIIYIIMITLGLTAFTGLFGGLMGFTYTGITSLFVIIGNLIYYAITMGIAGAVGGLISDRR